MNTISIDILESFIWKGLIVESMWSYPSRDQLNTDNKWMSSKGLIVESLWSHPSKELNTDNKWMSAWSFFHFHQSFQNLIVTLSL